MSGAGGMLYRRHSFTVPASNVSSTDVCEIRGYHVRSGPAKRRVCQHCGEVLPKDSPEQVLITRGEVVASDQDSVTVDWTSGPVTERALSETLKKSLEPGDLGEGTDEEFDELWDGEAPSST